MNEPTEVPTVLMDAMMGSPAWLLVWLFFLMLANMGALAFIYRREDGERRFRPECAAILFSFMAAAAAMEVIFASYGYVRLLGLGHLIFWTPTYLWILSRRSAIGTETGFGRYVHFYLVIAGISLVIDTIDVIRYALGDGAL
ncbi:MAG: hypothetical protein ACI8TX_002006 [Hyphomicrobiaceae bacterium]|jgi:hypothetical protein